MTDPPFLQEFVAQMVEMGAERVLILQGAQVECMRPLATHGLNSDLHWRDQISLSILGQALAQGEAVLLVDAQEGPCPGSQPTGLSSVYLLGVRSVLCVPLWNPNSQVEGILYADNHTTPGSFSRKAEDAGQRCARKLEKSLYGGEIEASAEKGADLAALGLRPAVAPRPVARTARPEATERLVAPYLAVTVFFRSLAEMVEAGLPITRALEVLCQGGDDRSLHKVALSLTGRVSQGTPLSLAMTGFPRIFTALEAHLVRVGEVTGALDSVLADIAAHRERNRSSFLKLRAALAYPVVIIIICLALLVFGPPYLLQEVFQMIRESGQEVPWFTQALMAFSNLLGQPWTPPALLAALLALLQLARASWKRPDWRLRLTRWGLRLPGAGRLLRMAATARFAQAVAMMYRVGMPLPDSIRTAAQSSGNAVLEKVSEVAVQALEAGAPLAEALRRTDFFPPFFVHLVTAGEESGKVDTTLMWVARVQEEEVEAALEQFLSMAEPLIIMGIGLTVGLVVLATALPMATLLQSL